MYPFNKYIKVEKDIPKKDYKKIYIVRKRIYYKIRYNIQHLNF